MHIRFSTTLHLYRKRLITEQNGPKYGPQGQIVSVYRLPLTVSVQGHSEFIWCISDFCRLKKHCVSKTASREAKRFPQKLKIILPKKDGAKSLQPTKSM